METSEQPKSEIRHTIRKHLDDLEQCLTGELTEKLAERKHCYISWRGSDCMLIRGIAFR